MNNRLAAIPYANVLPSLAPQKASHYRIYTPGGNELSFNAPPKVRTGREVIEQGANHLFTHLFMRQSPLTDSNPSARPKTPAGESFVFSAYDSIIQGVCKDRVLLPGQSEPVLLPLDSYSPLIATPVTQILYLYNHLLFGTRLMECGKGIGEQTFPTPIDIFLVHPEKSELMAASILAKAKNIGDTNYIQGNFFDLVSNMTPPGRIERREMQKLEAFQKELKWKYVKNFIEADHEICDIMTQFGLSPENTISMKDITPGQIQAGANIFGLETWLLRKAHALLRAIKSSYIEPGHPDNFMSVADRFFPGGAREWRRRNQNTQWDLGHNDDLGTYLTSRKLDENGHLFQPDYYFIGSPGGAPLCPLMVVALMMWAEKMGFSHILASFHFMEAMVANSGFEVGRDMFGVKPVTYALFLDRDPANPRPLESVRNGSTGVMVDE